MPADSVPAFHEHEARDLQLHRYRGMSGWDDDYHELFRLFNPCKCYKQVLNMAKGNNTAVGLEAQAPGQEEIDPSADTVVHANPCGIYGIPGQVRSSTAEDESF